MPKQSNISPALEKAVNELTKLATESKDFDKIAKAIEVAMRFEALKLKAKGPNWGKGFEDEEPEGGNEDDATF